MVLTRRVSPKVDTLFLIGLLLSVILSPVLGDLDFDLGFKTFDGLKLEHASVCETDISCELFGPGLVSTPCCGTCSCDPLCVQHGSCCLRVHKTFEDARASLENSRYNCVLSQFLPRTETDIDWGVYFWMIDKCHPGFSDDAIVDHCAQPGPGIDSVLPVTDPVTGAHYKNKYCALCNNIDDNLHLISWKFQIYDSGELEGSVPDKNLLGFIRETRGNIFFQPPGYIKVHSCNVPPYSISTCNETGQWPEYMYDENIEKACHSFLDPFNKTYQNYFCFLCNTAETVSPTNWTCIREPVEIGWPMGSEELLLDVSNNTNDALVCGSLQFEDDKMVVCRDVFCQNGEVTDGECILSSEHVNNTCLSVFIHLTSLSNKMYAHDSEWQENYFLNKLALWLTTVDGSEDEVLQEILVFTSRDAVNYLEYVVVYSLLKFMGTSDRNRFIEAVTMKHKTNITLQYRFEKEDMFFFELSAYNITRNSKIATISVLREPGVPVKDLRTAVPQPKSDTCLDKDALSLHKLYTCPYIVLRMEELPTKMENEFLIFTDPIFEDIDLKILSKWDYKIEGETIHICLEDYIPIYAKMSRPAADNDSPTSAARYQGVEKLSMALCLSFLMLPT